MDRLLKNILIYGFLISTVLLGVSVPFALVFNLWIPVLVFFSVSACGWIAIHHGSHLFSRKEILYKCYVENQIDSAYFSVIDQIKEFFEDGMNQHNDA